MTDSVRVRSAKVEAIAECWPMITALLGGTEEMREAGKTYLPQWPNEDNNFYQRRLAVATLLPAFARTVEVLSGKPFSRPVTWADDVPKSITDLFDDIDMQGTNLHSFLASVLEEAMGFGICIVLADYPTTSGEMTVAETKATGVRPYWVKICANCLLDWRSERINGREVLTHLRFVECVTEPDPADEFTEIHIEQVRVLDSGRWRVYREQKDSTTGEIKWVLHDEGLTTLNYVPGVPVYGKKLGFMCSKPPLSEIAYLNVEHWQSKSDQQTILHVARVPILFGKGFDPEEPITVGAATAVVSEKEQADLKYVEHTGKAIESGSKDLERLEDLMRQIGAELLVIKPGRVTVAQTRQEDESGTCALQRIVQDFEDAADQILQITAEWLGEKSGGSLTIYNDFGASSLAEATAQLLLDANIANVISNETLFSELQRRGLVKDNIKWDEEVVRIANQPPRSDSTKTNLNA
ncbi:TPA: DUF4055 domain-containing protein [Citrobacter murliniae]